MAGRMKMPKDSKIALLNVIKDKNAVLFGKFSSKLDNRMKHDAWDEVLIKAKSLQLVTENRDSTYIRDKLYYGLWKTTASEKRDNTMKTGTGGGKEKVLGRVDHLIFEILGNDTVILDELPVRESGVPGPDAKPFAKVTQNVDGRGANMELVPFFPEVVLETSGNAQTPETSTATDQGQRSSGNLKPPKRPFHRRHVSSVKEQAVLKKQKLECKLMESKMYLHRLEALKLEREMDWPLSKVTSVLFES